MAKYRIKQMILYDKEMVYRLQKRLWYIPFWRNLNNIDDYPIGYYYSFEKAKEAIERDRYKVKKKIIHLSDLPSNQKIEKNIRLKKYEDEITL